MLTKNGHTRNAAELIFFCFSLFALSCADGPDKVHRGSSAKMVGLLEKVAEGSSNWRNPYMHDLRVAHYDSMMRLHPDILQRQIGHYQKSLELLYAGRTREAIASLQELMQGMPNYQMVLGALYEEKVDMIQSALAVAYLRLGEQENCILNHTAASCIIPISAEGQHQWTEGSERAIQYYQQILEKDSTAYDAIWLMNIAYMTLGKYPEEVPTDWLIPTAAFVTETPIQTFKDVAMQAGVDVKALSGGSVLEDFNGDGYLDLLVSSWGVNDQLRYFQNTADGAFIDRTLESGLQGLVSGLNMVHADYNNDGWPDVLVLRGAWLNEHGLHPNSLIKNLGPDQDGVPRFVDVTAEAGVLSFRPTQTATWNDFNLDGWLDVYIGNETNPFVTEQYYPAELYMNNGDGTFREIGGLAGVGITSYIKGVTSGDYDNDGSSDIYISTLEDRNYLFRNEGIDGSGNPTFRDVTETAELDEFMSTFPTWFWDYDNDGWLDIFASGYNRGGNSSIAYAVAQEHLGLPYDAHMPHLFHNNGDGTFEDVTEAVGLQTILHAMGSNFGDIDNDGFLDMYLGTGDPDFRSIVPNRMFLNQGGKIFKDVTTAGGFGNLQKGHAVSFGDIDQDGDQDIYTVMGGANYGDIYQNLLFENPTVDNGSGGNWLTIYLEGTQTNRFGIGARVTITSKPEMKRTIFRDINSGGSFGCSPFRLEVGIGDATAVDLTIYWPVSRERQTIRGVQSGEMIRVIEGVDGFRSIDLPPFSFHNPEQIRHEH